MKTEELMSEKRKLIGISLLAIVALVAVLFAVSKQKEGRDLAEKPKECIELRGSGKQTYEIRTDTPSNLRIVQVDVDPIDVEEGQAQTITVKVRDDGNDTITQKSGVTANIKTDNKNTAVASFVLRLGEDSRDGSSLLTTWEGSWVKKDSTCYTYMETITATNDKGDEHSVDLSFK